MPVFNAYIFVPLSGKDAIRLVIIDPSIDDKAPLTCDIVEHRLSARNLDYSAVSYVWGDQKLSNTLEIRCSGDVGYLRITPNVEAVLKGLRKFDEPLYLWIDNICINQKDEDEKAQQIPIMGDIYKKAMVVDVWLGPEKETTTRILKFCRNLSGIPDVTKWKTQWEMAGQIVLLMGQFIHADAGVALEAISDFFQQPWFSRRWIIQEACLARKATVHCGKQSIGLEQLNQAAIRFQRMDLADYTIKVVAHLGPQTTKLGILELLWHFHDAQCVEPRDRIAAFLSLAKDGQQLRMDYTKAWDEIFEDLASFTYRLGQNDAALQMLFHLFEFGSVSNKEYPLYPSWVPDWSRSRQRRLPYLSGPKNTDTYETYPKSPGHATKATVAFNRGYLQIQGKVLGAGAQTFRVASLNCFRISEGLQKVQVRNIVEKLFPRVPDAKQEITALAILLQTISQFRHPIEETSRVLGRFEKDFENSHPDLDCRQILIWLRTLESVLTDFCLVELQPLGQSSLTTQGYGIGVESTLVDDIFIPLWRLQGERFDTSCQLSTMLAVRHVAEDFDSKGRFQVCRIIGPVVCVTWAQASSNTSDFRQSHSSGGLAVRIR